MKKWKIEFRGFVYVEADTEEDALEAYEEGDTVYEESEHNAPIEVEEFLCEIK